ncbi:MAG TPA: helix-turn-helix domain-containing protein [Pseudonocardiaceae bacterium]|nr:helix-turn-helix domain-containing protein [Pseudonocardiaceae bacterium]
MHRIAVVAQDDVVAFELGVPRQVFGSTAAVDERGEPLYEIRTCTLDGKPVMTTAGYRADPDHGPEILADADTVILPGIHSGLPVTEGTLTPQHVEAFESIRPGARLVSICTSAFVLAAAGRLDGLRATTHWLWTNRFARLFPHIELDPNVLWVDNGEVLTSAGNAAGFDLCLHILRRDHGSEIANRVARHCVLPPWRDGGQAQFIDRPMPDPDGTSTTDVRAWALARLDQPLDLTALASQATMSVRTFTRRFREETGLSPNKWLTQQRVDRARHLLESTDLSVDRIAEDVGFGTGTSLRLHLHARLGVPPLAYRRTFRAAKGVDSAARTGRAERSARSSG